MGIYKDSNSIKWAKIADNFQRLASVEILIYDADFVEGYDIYQYIFGIQLCSTLAKCWKLSKKDSTLAKCWKLSKKIYFRLFLHI